MAIETRAAETTHHTRKRGDFSRFLALQDAVVALNPRGSIAVELAVAKQLAQSPKCPGCRRQRGIPDNERRIHYPARSHSNSAQQEGKEIPCRDVDVIPRIVGHRIVGEIPSFHLAE